MFEKLFQFIRQGVKAAILGGIEDAQAEMTQRIEAQEHLLIEGEAELPETNGRAKRRVVTR
jgi:hypothetical protein